MNKLRPNPGDFGGPNYHQYPRPFTLHHIVRKPTPPKLPKSPRYGIRFNTDVLTAPRRRRRSSDTHSRASSKNLISPHNTLYPGSAHYYDVINEEKKEEKEGNDTFDHNDGNSSDPDASGATHLVAATTRPASARTYSEMLARAWADLMSALWAAVVVLRWLGLAAVLLAGVGMFIMTTNMGEYGRAGSEPTRHAARQEAAAARFRAALDEAGGGFDLGRAVLVPVAAAYGRWLLDTEAETWFAGARDADDVLEALYVAWAPPSSGVGDEGKDGGRGGNSSSSRGHHRDSPEAAAARVHLRRLLDERAGHCRRAEVRFENFLHARLATAERLLEAARAFRIYVGTRLGSGGDPLVADYLPSRDAVRAAEKAYGFIDARVPKMLDSDGAGAKQARRANLTLHHAGARFLRIMETTHANLYGEQSVPPRLTTLVDIERAADAERSFVDDLLRDHPWRALWTPKHAGALQQLAGRLERLETQLQAVEARLSWHAEQLEAAAETAVATENDDGNPPPWAPVTLHWPQTADDMVAGLEALITTAVPRLTWARRHRTALRHHADTRDLVGAWHRRLLRRCAASPCFDAVRRRAAGAPGAGWRVWWAQLWARTAPPRPAADPGRLEDGRRETACCGTSRAPNEWAHLLYTGDYDEAAGIVYQNPHLGRRPLPQLPHDPKPRPLPAEEEDLEERCQAGCKLWRGYV